MANKSEKKKNTNTTKKNSTVNKTKKNTNTTNKKKANTTVKKNTSTKKTQVNKTVVKENVVIKKETLPKDIVKEEKNETKIIESPKEELTKQEKIEKEVIKEIKQIKEVKLENAKFEYKKQNKKLILIGVFISLLGIIALIISLIANRIIDREYISDISISLMVIGSILIEAFGAFIIINET